MEKLLTARQVAEWLNLHVVTIYEYAREGSLPSIKIGTSVRFEPEVVRAWAGIGTTKLEALQSAEARKLYFAALPEEVD